MSSYPTPDLPPDSTHDHEHDHEHDHDLAFETSPGPSVGDQTRSGADRSTKDVASEQTSKVADEATSQVAAVAGEAKAQTSEVVSEAVGQAKALFAQAKSEFGDQAGVQHQRAAAGLHTLADELRGMADASSERQEGSGVATDLARQASERVHGVAEWLDSHETGDLLDEVRRFAARKPGQFLLGAAVLGLIGGRLTRGLADDARSQSDDQSDAQRQYGYRAPMPTQSGMGTGAPAAGVPSVDVPGAGVVGTGVPGQVGHGGGAGLGDPGYATADYTDPMGAADADPLADVTRAREVRGDHG